MKKIGTLNKELSDCIAGIGHTDMLVVCDAGLPIPQENRRIDLAVRPGLPSFFDVLDTILEEMVVEKIIIAEETKEVSPQRFDEMVERFPSIEVETMPHIEFKKTAKAAKGFVRTGECVSYSNMILVAGVTY
jgi:D-ribose pyranase